MTWWLVSGDLYEEGDVIPAGRWGRRVLGIGPAHAQYFRELLVEHIRRDDFPARPSRLTSSYAFEQAEHADRFQREGRQSELVYEVDPVDPSAVTFRADLSWWDRVRTLRHPDAVYEWAQLYWALEPRPGGEVEVLHDGALRVVRRASPLGDDDPQP